MILYQEQLGQAARRWFFWVAGATAISLLAAIVLRGIWVLVLGALIGVLLFLGPEFHKNMYHSITLDTETLRVGRDTILVNELDPSVVTERLRGVDPTFIERWNASPNVPHWAAGGRRRRRGEPSIMGCPWEIPNLMQSIVLKDQQGREFQVATRNRRTFLWELAKALPPR